MKGLLLRLVRSGLLLVLAMAGGNDCSGLKTGGATGVSFTGISTTVNVSVGAAGAGAAEGAAQAVDPAASKPSATEIEGTPQHGCLSAPHEDVCW